MSQALPPTEPNLQATIEKKILIRRSEMIKGKIHWHDHRHVQLWRHTVQAGFAVLNIYMGVMFYLWVRYYETGAQGTPIAKPEGVAGWLPIAGLMNLKYTLVTFEMPPIHAAAMFLLLAFLLISLVLKKAFCSWLCPIGTLSEMLWKSSHHFLGRNFYLPKWLDIPLRSLKYVLLGFFLYIAYIMSAEAIKQFMSMPYGLIADVKMLNFFRYIGSTALITIGVILFGSLFIPNLWCRYLCPYGALMGLVSIFSPYKIRRDADACIDCGKCAKVCPSRLPVDVKMHISSPECTACQSCVDICPAQHALQFSLKPRPIAAKNGDTQQLQRRWNKRSLSGCAVAILLVLILGGMICIAKFTGYWQSPLPDEMYQVMIPRAQNFPHP